MCKTVDKKLVCTEKKNISSQSDINIASPFREFIKESVRKRCAVFWA
jgi:hypothetical protein